MRHLSPPRLRFDFVDGHGRPDPLLFERPERVIDARVLADVMPAMREADAALGAGCAVAGFVSYEAAPAFDPALATREPSGPPLVWFGVFRTPAVPPADPPRGPDRLPPIEWTSDVTSDEYGRAIARVRDAIAAGDVYQANYTFRMRAAIDPGDLHERYRRLRDDQRPPYAASLDLGTWHVLSLSPELFFRCEGGTIASRPMKGTHPRGRWAADDAREAARLAASAKNRAENVMIVDLVRNDIGRIAEIGSVRVPALFEVERYPAVFQLVSSVEGRLRPRTTLTDVFAALFPAGSITGAPKTSSMRLLSRIETTPRGVYCGAIGYALPGGRAVFSVAIRTATVHTGTGRAEYGVGGGITWDSDVRDEHAEALSKASFLDEQPAFELLETMRLEEGTIGRVDRHLDRIAASAVCFGFAFDRAAVHAALADHATTRPGGPWRVRLRLSRDGRTSVESTALTGARPPAGDVPRVALATAPVSSRDRFLFHKTTHRAVHDAHRATDPDAFDVLLWNEAGEATEFTFGNLVAEIDGARWTPPLDCGLLGGVFRAELLERGAIAERRLPLDDLRRATRLWHVNSVRGETMVALGVGRWALGVGRRWALGVGR